MVFVLRLIQSCCGILEMNTPVEPDSIVLRVASENYLRIFCFPAGRSDPVGQYFHQFMGYTLLRAWKLRKLVYRKFETPERKIVLQKTPKKICSLLTLTTMRVPRGSGCVLRRNFSSLGFYLKFFMRSQEQLLFLLLFGL